MMELGGLMSCHAGMGMEIGNWKLESWMVS